MLNHREGVEPSKFSVLVFGTPGCGHCKALFTALEGVYMQHSRFSLAYMDYFENRQLAEMLGIERMVPYSVILEKGNVIQSFSGNRITEISAAILSLINTSESQS